MVAEGKVFHFSDMRVLFFGMSGILSRVPLTFLLNEGVRICGLVIPAAIIPPYLLPADGRAPFVPQATQSSSVNLMANSGLLALAAKHQLPVFPGQRLRTTETIERITAVAPDLICVSCFDQILPPKLLEIPTFGCLNLHPSLLPHFRGPTPLFWILRAGLKETGVTVHFMDEGIDTGDIALQAKLTLPDGLSGAQIEQMCAERGGRLLLQAIHKLSKGMLPRRPQPAGGSYQPAPTPADFRLESSWSARRAFNFMRGTLEYGRPYYLQLDGRELWLYTAVSYQADQKQAEPVQLLEANRVSLQFSPGTLVAHTTQKIT